jgi:hypothetical protein
MGLRLIEWAPGLAPLQHDDGFALAQKRFEQQMAFCPLVGTVSYMILVRSVGRHGCLRDGAGKIIMLLENLRLLKGALRGHFAAISEIRFPSNYMDVNLA